MLSLILGTAGSGKTSRILNEIRKNAGQGQIGQYLIVPEQYSHEAERELCTVCGSGISLSAEVLSFSRLAVRVAQETGTGGKVALDKAGRLLCMSLAIEKVSPALKLYTSAARKTELQSSIFEAVDELRAAGISSDDLSKAAQGAVGQLKNKLSDLSLCLEAYTAVLANGHADPADRLNRLAETLGQSSVGSGHIYIDGFVDFTGMEMQVLDALIKKGADITVCLTCDGLDGTGEQFEPSRKAAFALLRCAKEHDVPTNIEVVASLPEKSDVLSFYDEHLFSYTSEKMSDPESRVSLYRCGGIREECEMAAWRCIGLVRDSDCRWRDIAVAVRGFDGYSAALEDIFRQYGVPLFTARRGSILQKSAPAVIADAFEIILGGWDTGDVISYIKTGLTGLTQSECDEVECYAQKWNIRGSYWYRAESWTLHPSGFGAPWDDASREKLAEIDHLRRKLTAPLFDLEKLGKTAETAAQQAQALSDFLVAIDLPATLSTRADELEVSGRSLLASEMSQLWDIIVNALEQFAAILGDTPMDQSEFSKLFSKVLSQYDVSSIPASPDSVSAGEADRMRRRHIKHLIILGASDDRIPAVGDSVSLLTDDDRDELRELGIDLGGGIDRLPREFSLIYNCITLPSESVTVSYSVLSPDGAKNRPSFLLTRAQLLFGVEENTFDVTDARLCAKKPAMLLAAEGCIPAMEYFSSSDEGKAALDNLHRRAETDVSGLSESSVSALYGKTHCLSPSQVESFSSCRFAYFLRYGLRLDENRPADFDPPEMGTFMHYVLENSLREISDGAGFENATPELASQLADKYTDKYIAERIGNFEDRSARFRYLFDRMRPSVHRVVTDTIRELSRSDFRPLDFELSFRDSGDLPAVKVKNGGCRIIGVADRVDGCERDGKLYLRVVDYKTGKKKFELSDIWNGMGLQMLIYLFALEDEGEKRYGKEIVPAGVIYIPAKDVTVSVSGDIPDEKLSEERSKKLRRSGLILNDEGVISAMEHGDDFEFIPVKRRADGTFNLDTLATPQQMEALREFIGETLSDVSENLSGGSIDAEPCYRSETDNACRYCAYARVCRFDDADGKRRYLSKLKPAEFWSRLEAKQDEKV